MNSKNVIKIISITTTVLNLASGLLSNWVSDKNMKLQISEEVNKQLHKRK